MRCSDIQLDLDLGKEEAGARWPAIDRHLARCAECQRYQARGSQLDALLAFAAAAPLTTPNLQEAVLAQLEGVAVPVVSPWSRGLALAAGVVFCLAVLTVALDLIASGGSYSLPSDMTTWPLLLLTAVEQLDAVTAVAGILGLLSGCYLLVRWTPVDGELALASRHVWQVGNQ